MTNFQIENEVDRLLNTFENMEAMGIINANERKKLITSTKSWAYDQMKLNE